MNEKVKLKVEYVKLEELIPFELNARTHSKEQVGQIVNSIGEFDFVNPILVGVDNMIIAGHGRLMAAKRPDWKRFRLSAFRILTITNAWLCLWPIIKLPTMPVGMKKNR